MQKHALNARFNFVAHKILEQKMSINDNRSRIQATARTKKTKNAVIHPLQLGNDERNLLRLIYLTQASVSSANRVRM